MTIRSLCVGAAMLVATTASGFAETLRMAHIFTPGNPWYEAAEAYAKAVKERSKGEITIQIAHSSSTGDWPQSIEGLLIGTNDIVLQSIGTLDRYNPIAGIEAYPYLIRDVEHFKKVYYGPLGAELFNEIAEKTKFRIIGAGYRGARHLSSNRKIEKVEDLKGLKLRVPPIKSNQLTWEYLGASPVPMGASELFTSLQQGVVDGQENPLEIIDNLKLYEAQKNVAETAHVIGAYTFIFSDARFQAFSPETQAILREEGEKVMLAATQTMIEREAGIKASLEKKGLAFNQVDREAFKARLKDLPSQFPEFGDWISRIEAVK